jgi:hypothetical protein
VFLLPMIFGVGHYVHYTNIYQYKVWKNPSTCCPLRFSKRFWTSMTNIYKGRERAIVGKTVRIMCISLRVIFYVLLWEALCMSHDTAQVFLETYWLSSGPTHTWPSQYVAFVLLFIIIFNTHTSHMLSHLLSLSAICQLEPMDIVVNG